MLRRLDSAPEDMRELADFKQSGMPTCKTQNAQCKVVGLSIGLILVKRYTPALQWISRHTPASRPPLECRAAPCASMTPGGCA